MMSPTIWAQVFVNGLALSAIYILIALGFTLLFGIMRVVNFAHGEFAMLGGFSLYYLYGQFNIPWIAAVPLSALLVATAALVLERFVFRWFYQRMFQSMIGLMGLSMVLMFSSLLIWDAYERNVPSPFSSIIEIGDVVLPTDRLVVILVAAIALLLFYLFMQHSRHGLSMRAAAIDLEVAQAQGIETERVYKLAFFIAIFMTALAGGLYTQTYVLSPLIGERPLMIAFIVVVLGGMGSIPGAALGGLILGFVESFLGTFYGAAVSAFVSFGVVLALIIFRPWGLLGKPE